MKRFSLAAWMMSGTLALTALLSGCASSAPQSSSGTSAASSEASASKSGEKSEASGTESTASSSTSAAADQPVLRVAMEAAYAPFNWTQTDDSNDAWPIEDTKEYANGYDVMVAKMICDTIDYKLEIYKTDWDSLILGLNANKYDALICGMNILPERKESVAFSTPYRTIKNCVIVRKDSKYASAKSIKDLDGAKCITQMNSNWEPLIPEIPNSTALPGTSTSNEIAAQVVAGKADVGITDDPTASVMCLSNPDLTYIVFDEGKGFSTDGEESSSMGIAVRKSDTDLLKKIDDAMESNNFDADKQEEYMQKALSILPQSELDG